MTCASDQFQPFSIRTRTRWAPRESCTARRKDRSLTPLSSSKRSTTTSHGPTCRSQEIQRKTGNIVVEASIPATTRNRLPAIHRLKGASDPMKSVGAAAATTTSSWTRLCIDRSSAPHLRVERTINRAFQVRADSESASACPPVRTSAMVSTPVFARSTRRSVNSSLAYADSASQRADGIPS